MLLGVYVYRAQHIYTLDAWLPAELVEVVGFLLSLEGVLLGTGGGGTWEVWHRLVVHVLPLETSLMLQGLVLLTVLFAPV